MFRLRNKSRRCAQLATKASTVLNGRSSGIPTSRNRRLRLQIMRRSLASAWATPRPAACRRLGDLPALSGSAIHDRLARRVPIHFLAREIRLGGHHARDGMREAVVYRGMRLLARTHAFEPVGHVLQRQIVNAHGRKAAFSRQRNELRLSLLVHVGVVLVRSLLFNLLIARAALSTNIDEGGVLAHVARKARRVVAEAGRIAHQKTL